VGPLRGRNATVTRTVINGSAGLYSIDLKGSKTTVDQSNAVFGAAQTDHKTDAGLPVPTPPEAVKSLAASGG